MSQQAAQANVDEAAAALSSFLTSIFKLKGSGLLGMITYLAENGDDSFLSLATDPSIMRLMALAASLAQGLSRVDSDELSRAQINVAGLTSCGFTALGRVNLYEPRSVGLLGLADRLRDPDVGTSAWLVLELLRGLGHCVKSKSKRA